MLVGIDPFPSPSRDSEVTGAVAVDTAAQALLLDHLPQSSHHGSRRFFFHQLGVIDLAGRVIEHGQQIVAALILKPAMLTGIDV